MSIDTPQQQRPDVNDILMGSGDGPSAPFLKLGPANNGNPERSPANDFRGGRIIRVSPTQAYKLSKPDATGKRVKEYQTYQTGAKTGLPIWDVLVVLQTAERDPQIEGDDGIRQVQLDGFDMTWKDRVDFDCRKRAVRLAVTAAGQTKLEAGGELYLAWVRQVPSAGGIPATHWTARYVPPGQSVDMVEPAPVQQQYAPQAPVQHTYVPQPQYAPQQPAQPAYHQPQYQPAQQQPAAPVQQPYVPAGQPGGPEQPPF